MMPRRKSAARRGPSSGFTLIELLVVVLIIGILASIAVPQYAKIVEKGRIAEALSCAGAVKNAEERYMLKNNTYVAATSLDVNCLTGLKFFTGTITPAATAWTIAFTRTGALPPVYSNYTFQFTAGNGGTPAFTSGTAAVVSDLLP